MSAGMAKKGRKYERDDIHVAQTGVCKFTKTQTAMQGAANSVNTASHNVVCDDAVPLTMQSADSLMSF